MKSKGRRRWIKCYGSALLCALLLACSSEKPIVLAEFHSQSISDMDLKRAYRMERALIEEFAGQRLPFDKEAVKRRILENLIVHRLLLSEARLEGVTIDAVVLREHLKQLRTGYSKDSFEEQLSQRGLSLDEWEAVQQEKFLIETWMRREAIESIAISTSELKEYYHKNSKEFIRPEQVRARHIVVSVQSQAEEILARLKEGESFEELARQYSYAPEAKQGGDLGYFSRDDYPPIFTETCFKLKKGKISDIVVSDYGFHIFQVIDRTRKKKRGFQEVINDIQERVRNAKFQELIEQRIESLKTAYNLKINEQALREVEL